MSRKKVSTTIYITPEQAERLKLLHERTKVPIAVFIREGIDLMLKHYEPVLPGQMSLESASPQPPAPQTSAVASGATSTPMPARREPIREPVATLRTGTGSVQGSRSDDGGE
jgi:Ribbon-helix-helix domain